jgi:site-specific DNA recombinase
LKQLGRHVLWLGVSDFAPGAICSVSKYDSSLCSVLKSEEGLLRVFAGQKATYEYYICRGKQDGFCDMAYLPVAELEDAVARCIAKEELPQDFIDLLRDEVEQATKNNEESDREMRDNLARQLKKLEGREDGLLDLAADRELNSAKLKERLRTIALERGSIQERLERTDKDLERGASTILTYLELLAEPGNLYDRSPNNVKRQLLEAFFAALRADIGDRIDVEGVEKEPVAELRDGAQALRTRQASDYAPSRKNKFPRLPTGELELQTNVNSLADFFKTHFSSKATLVAGTGFEPATSGL